MRLTTLCRSLARQRQELARLARIPMDHFGMEWDVLEYQEVEEVTTNHLQERGGREVQGREEGEVGKVVEVDEVGIPEQGGGKFGREKLQLVGRGLNHLVTVEKMELGEKGKKVEDKKDMKKTNISFLKKVENKNEKDFRRESDDKSVSSKDNQIVNMVQAEDKRARMEAIKTEIDHNGVEVENERMEMETRQAEVEDRREEVERRFIKLEDMKSKETKEEDKRTELEDSWVQVEDRRTELEDRRSETMMKEMEDRKTGVEERMTEVDVWEVDVHGVAEVGRWGEDKPRGVTGKDRWNSEGRGVEEEEVWWKGGRGVAEVEYVEAYPGQREQMEASRIPQKYLGYHNTGKEQQHHQGTLQERGLGGIHDDLVEDQDEYVDIKEETFNEHQDILEDKQEYEDMMAAPSEAIQYEVNFPSRMEPPLNYFQERPNNINYIQSYTFSDRALEKPAQASFVQQPNPAAFVQDPDPANFFQEPDPANFILKQDPAILVHQHVPANSSQQEVASTFVQPKPYQQNKGEINMEGTQKGKENLSLINSENNVNYVSDGQLHRKNEEVTIQHADSVDGKYESYDNTGKYQNAVAENPEKYMGKTENSKSDLDVFDKTSQKLNYAKMHKEQKTNTEKARKHEKPEHKLLGDKTAAKAVHTESTAATKISPDKSAVKRKIDTLDHVDIGRNGKEGDMKKKDEGKVETVDAKVKDDARGHPAEADRAGDKMRMNLAEGSLSIRINQGEPRAAGGEKETAAEMHADQGLVGETTPSRLIANTTGVQEVPLALVQSPPPSSSVVSGAPQPLNLPPPFADRLLSRKIEGEGEENKEIEEAEEVLYLPAGHGGLYLRMSWPRSGKPALSFFSAS